MQYDLHCFVTRGFPHHRRTTQLDGLRRRRREYQHIASPGEQAFGRWTLDDETLPLMMMMMRQVRLARFCFLRPPHRW